ncbi:MAG: hypothetical protein ACRDJ9_07210, partial [Dehalococcoidia bacterium]
MVVVDVLRFDGAILDTAGASLGEARLWAIADRSEAESPWRGWLRVTDLGTNELPAGRYRVRAVAGWEGEFEPAATRPSRVFEIDLLPFQGIGDAPWPETSEDTRPRYQPLWNDTPPRTADDRTRFPDLQPLDLGAEEGLPAEG